MSVGIFMSAKFYIKKKVKNKKKELKGVDEVQSVKLYIPFHDKKQ